MVFLPLNHLLCRINPHVKMVVKQIVIGAIRPIFTAQNIRLRLGIRMPRLAKHTHRDQKDERDSLASDSRHRGLLPKGCVSRRGFPRWKSAMILLCRRGRRSTIVLAIFRSIRENIRSPSFRFSFRGRLPCIFAGHLFCRLPARCRSGAAELECSGESRQDGRAAGRGCEGIDRGADLQGRDGKQQGLGTGFVISADGLIATNLHVIGEARPITVQLADGSRHEATAVHASDKKLDLAIVKIDAKRKLKPLELGIPPSSRPGRRRRHGASAGAPAQRHRRRPLGRARFRRRVDASGRHPGRAG